MFQNWIKCLLLKCTGSALKSSATQVRALIASFKQYPCPEDQTKTTQKRKPDPSPDK